jgi:hypothetical protein
MHWAMGYSFALAAAFAALTSQSAIPIRPPGLDPSGPWTVEVTEGACLVGRKFDAAGSEFTLGFSKTTEPGDLQLLVWAPKRSTEVSKGKARLAFDQATPFEARYRSGPVTVAGLELTEITAESAQVGMLDKVDTLHIKAGDLTISFKLRGVAGALKALADCQSKLPGK